MFLKFGGGKTKNTSTESFDRSGTSTTQATLPDWLMGPSQGLVGQIGAFSEIDPRSLVAGPSSLQQQAFTAAGGLLGGAGSGLLPAEGAPGRESPAGQGGTSSGPAWQGLLNGGASLAAQAATAGPNLAQTYLSQGVTPGTAATATMPAMGPAATAAFTPAAMAGMASGGGASGGAATGYAASAGAMDPSRGYTANTADGLAGGGVGAARVGPAATARSESLLDGLQNYMDPYLNSVVSARTADLNEQQAAQQAALLGSQGKRNAFGGSGVSIENTMLGSSQQRDRNTILSGLLSDGFKAATGLSGQDADRRQQVGIRNADATDLMARAQGDLDIRGIGIDADLRAGNRDAINQASEFGAGAFNERNLAAGRNATDASIATAGNMTSASETTSRNATDASIASANNATSASIANLDAQTRTNIANMNSQVQVALENARSVNEQANLLAQLGVDVSTSNAAEINDMAQQALQLAQENQQFNAGQMNEGEQFNAGQMDTALARALDAAGLLGTLGASYGEQTRGDIGLLGELGATQRGIEQEGLLAGLNLTSAQIEMLAPFLSQLTGQTQTTSETGTSTGTSKGTSTQAGFGFDLGWSPKGGFSLGNG